MSGKRLNLRISIRELIFFNRDPAWGIIAIDPWFIVESAPTQSRLIELARKVNDKKALWVIERVKLAISTFLSQNPSKVTEDIKIICYGFSI